MKVRLGFIEPAIMLATVIQWLVLASLTGLVVGMGVSLFLLALFSLAGQSFGLSLWLQMTLLPLAGLANGLLFYYGYKLNQSSLKDSILIAVHQQAGRLPFKTFLIKPVAALITLAAGGSAGKEGPGSHLGASLASGLGLALRVNPELQKRLVACGVSAGFASVFGTPIAGAIYGVEILAVGRVRHDFLLPAIIAGITAYQVSVWMGVPYESFNIAIIDTFSQWLFVKTILVGVLCGLAARLYVDLFHFSKKQFLWLQTKLRLWPPLTPALGGCILAVLLTVLPSGYFGLSLPIMNQALAGENIAFIGFVWKALLVAITLGSGFYGGVVTPQLVIGAVFGSALSGLFNIDPTLGAAVGLVAVLAAASNTPIAAILMSVELFDGGSLLYVAGAAMAAYLIIGHRSIYPDQQLAYAKSSWIKITPDLPIGHEKARLSYGLLRWWQEYKKK